MRAGSGIGGSDIRDKLTLCLGEGLTKSDVNSSVLHWT